MILTKPTEKNKEHLLKAFQLSKRLNPFGDTSIATLKINYMIIPREHKSGGFYPIQIMNGKKKGWLYDRSIYFFVLEDSKKFHTVLRQDLEDCVQELLKDKIFSKTAEPEKNTLMKSGDKIIGLIDLPDLVEMNAIDLSL
jgi:hypothetical protein